MIKRLRIKFIILSMLAVLALLAVIVTAMNVTNYNSVVAEADSVLAVLSENGGSFPEMGKRKGDKPPEEFDHPDTFFDDDILNDLDDMEEWTEEMFQNGKMSPETPYESRFFSVVLNEDGEVVRTDISRIRAVDTETAAEYAATVFAQEKTAGFIESYRYIKCQETDGTRIIFLDWGRKMASFHSFLLFSILTALGGYIVFFFVIVFFSKRIIRPVAESYEKQKRFITDAGHEIKTPLTIIKADADILEMDLGEGNEWLEDIQKQTSRLASLTNDLIYLARTEEASDAAQMVEFPLSDVVEEAASSFAGPAKAQNKEFRMDIQPMISLKGDEKKIGQLVGILLDNALKYSPSEGSISLRLEKPGKNIILSVSNDTIDPVSKENLAQMFDRFYRMDASRNSKTGGYGIGLSIAKAIVEAHGGRIQARTDDGKSLTITVTF